MGSINQITSTVKRKQIISIVTGVLLDLSGAVLYKGLWNPSGGTLPGTGNAGWLYKASADGTVNGFFIPQGAWIFLLTNNPGQTLSNYDIR